MRRSPGTSCPGQRRTKIHAELPSNGCAPKSAGSRRQCGDHPAGENFHAVCSSNGCAGVSVGQQIHAVSSSDCSFRPPRTTQGQPRPELRDASAVMCVVTDQGTERTVDNVVVDSVAGARRTLGRLETVGVPPKPPATYSLSVALNVLGLRFALPEASRRHLLRARHKPAEHHIAMLAKSA